MIDHLYFLLPAPRFGVVAYSDGETLWRFGMVVCLSNADDYSFSQFHNMVKVLDDFT